MDKKWVFSLPIVLIIVSLIMAGCPQEKDKLGPAKLPKEFWGEWIGTQNGNSSGSTYQISTGGQIIEVISPDNGGDAEASNFVDAGNFEPNDTEYTAALITDNIMSYLHTDDADYFKFRIE